MITSENETVVEVSPLDKDFKIPVTTSVLRTIEKYNGFDNYILNYDNIIFLQTYTYCYTLRI